MKDLFTYLKPNQSIKYLKRTSACEVVGFSTHQQQGTNSTLIYSLKCDILGFPGGAVIENLPANVGDTGSSPGLGRSHMPRSNWACEPQLLSLRVWSLCFATREAMIVRGPRTAMKSGPHLPQLDRKSTRLNSSH